MAQQPVPSPNPNPKATSAPGFNPGEVNTASATGTPQMAGAVNTSAANPSGPDMGFNYELIGLAMQIVQFLTGISSGGSDMPMFRTFVRGVQYEVGPIPVRRI